jgi:hypothetical protein
MTTTSIAPVDVTVVTLSRFLETLPVVDLYGRYIEGEIVAEDGITPVVGVITHVAAGYLSPVGRIRPWLMVQQDRWVTISPEMRDLEDHAMVEVTGAELAAIEAEEAAR